MRRITGLVASGLGAFLIGVALLIHFFVVNVAVKFPLNAYTKTKLEGQNMSYFSNTKLTELSSVTMRATNTTKGDVAAGTNSRAVYDTFSYLYDVTNKKPYSYSLTRLAFDRRTGALINCCDTAVDTHTNIRVSGIGLLFPLGTKKQTYQVFNTTLLKAVPARYVGEDTVDGLTTYKFVSEIPATKVGDQQVPGTLVGSKQPTVTLGEFFQGTYTYYVDPGTGVPVSVSKQQHVALRDSTGTERLVLLDGELKTTPSTAQKLVDTVNHDNFLISLLDKIVPLSTGIAGIVLFAIGGILLATSREEDEVDEVEDY
jgi:hypothetical protein